MIQTGTFLDSFAGGIARGKIYEFWGKWSSGKTTLALQITAALQKRGEKGVWASIESFDPKYAAFRGVDNSKLGFIANEYSEAVMDEVIDVIRAEKHDFVVIDSLGAITPRAEMEKSVGETTMAGQSKIIARFLRNVSPLHNMGNKTIVICTNQQTMNFNTGRAMPRGGEAAGHFKDLSLHLTPLGIWIKQGDKTVGKKIKITADKSKIFGVDEHKSMETELFWDAGFNAEADLILVGIERGIITKTGNTHWVAGEKLGTISKVREWLKIEENAIKLKEML